MKVLVIIPTYNEQANIERLLDGVLRLPFPIEAVVVDDNSPDGTGRLADNLAAGEARIYVIHRPAKLGLGTAHIAGFKYALAQKADLILTMDADFSHDPAHIPALIEASRKFDVVIGSRYTTGGATLNSPPHRLLLSRCANLFAKTTLKFSAGDCTSGFRCYRAGVFAAVDLDGIFSEGYSFLIELLCRLQRSGFTIAERPIRFADRESGVSKISNKEIFKAFFAVFRLAFCRG